MSPKTTLVQTNFTYANVFFSATLVRDFSATFITEGNAFRGVRGRWCMNLQLIDFQSCGGLQSAERKGINLWTKKKRNPGSVHIYKALIFFLEHGSTSAFSWLLAINLMFYLVKSLRNTVILKS